MMDMDENKQAGQSSGGDLSKRQGLIAVNDLTYVLEPDLSVASNKTHKVHYFQANEYTSGQNAICILNSGADYIDTRRSWLQFDVKTPAGAAATFGANGSACNLISQLTVSTRSGDVLCQLFDYNLLQAMLLPITYDKGWVDTVGQTMGYGGGIAANTEHRLMIPMYLLSPLFAYGRLMPAMLMSGLRIEILWADANVALKSDGAAIASYKISKPQFVLSSIQLSDSIQRSLNELSATNGLEIVYTDYERTPFTQNNNLSNAHIEIRKSCSRALKAFARIRQRNFAPRVDAIEAADGVVPVAASGGVGPEHAYDSLKSEQMFPVYEYQWQLGSLYFPQQPVRSNNNAAGCKQVALSAYSHLLEACDKYHDGSRPMYTSFYGTFATPDEYKVRTTASQEIEEPGSYTYDAHTIAVTLERSTMFNLAGVPVNNSRVLALHAKLLETSPTAYQPIRQIDVFLKYVKLARVFLNNVEVEQ
jgi:hypothetical protein